MSASGAPAPDRSGHIWPIAFIVSEAQLPLRVRPAAALTDDELFELCCKNRDLRIERTAAGELIVMPPTGAETGRSNFDLLGQLFIWVRQDGTGIAFDSSTGFILPNGAERSPDASWVKKTRWAALSDEEKKKFAPLCPDFVAELRSPSDRLGDVQDKLEEYISCGAALGWLIDPPERRVHIYRPGRPVAVLDNPATVSGDPELPGFVIDLTSIW